MRAITTLAIKDLKLLIRDRMALFWSLAFPLIFALFFGSIMGGGDEGRGKMSMVVVDEASSESSAAFVERLDASDSLQVDVAPDLEAARGLVRKGERVAFVRITKDFSDGPFALFGGSDEPTIELGVDPSHTAERGMLQGLVTQSLMSGLGAQFRDPEAMAKQVEVARRSLANATDIEPAQKKAVEDLFVALGDFSKQAEADPEPESGGGGFGEGLVALVDIDRDRTGKPRSVFEVTFPSAMIWGLIGVAITFAASLVRERTAGTLLRLRVAPLSHAQLLAGKGLACFLAGIGVSGSLLAFGVLALGVNVVNPGLLLVALPCAAACFTGIMMVLSVIGRTEAAVSGGSWALIMPLAMLGGGMVPLIAMPKWMLALSNISPLKWAILAIEGAIWRDMTLADIALPITVLLAVTALLFAVGVAVLRRQLR